MDAVWARRMRWRRRGAWMWPAFIAGVLADGLIGHALPLQGDGEGFAPAVLVGLVLNLLAVILLCLPLAVLLRRYRPGLPMVVARDHAGTLLVVLVSLVLVAGGLAHHSSVAAEQSAMRDAISRAQAYIGDRAPAEFRRNVAFVSTFTIQPGSIYRACVPGQVTGRTYCVVVNTTLPFARSVRFSGYEPNSTLSQGAW